MAKKDELLRLYARDAKEKEGEMGAEEEGNPKWVNVLAEECKELRESNLQLWQEVGGHIAPGVSLVCLAMCTIPSSILSLLLPSSPLPLLPLLRRIVCAMKQPRWNARREN